MVLGEMFPGAVTPLFNLAVTALPRFDGVRNDERTLSGARTLRSDLRHRRAFPSCVVHLFSESV